MAFALASYDKPNLFLDDFQSFGRLRLIYHVRDSNAGSNVNTSKDIATFECSEDKISNSDLDKSFYPPQLFDKADDNG